jgi:hypothetical protein
MRWRSALLTVCSVVAIAACGGDGGQEVEQQTDTGPTIDRAVAEDLAARSEGVASLLDDGDACGAREEAELLRRDLTQAIQEGEIPELYLEDLSGLVNEIEAGIPTCEAPPPPPPPTYTAPGDGDD